MNKAMVIFLAIVAGILMASTGAMALTTPVSDPGGDGLVSTLEGTGGILDRLYGLTNLMRIDDNDDHTFSLTAGEYAVYGEAKYAGFNQEIGVRTTSGDQDLFYVKDNFDNGRPGKEAFHMGSFTLASDEEVKFYDDPSGNPLWTTDPSDNVENPAHPNGFDLAVTYKIIAGEYMNDYVIAFEDKNGNDGGPDFDYNDMVIRVAPVPEPGTILLLGFGLAGLGFAGRRRMKK